MDYVLGFRVLQDCFAEAPTELRAELNTLEDKFRQNERAERIFGSSENTRNERAQIVYALNELALKHCGVSFNELCQGAEPTRRPDPAATLREEPPPMLPLAVPFKVQLSMRSRQRFEVRAFHTPMGEPPPSVSRLPYTEEELAVVLKALRLSAYDENAFKPNQRDVLRQQGLLLDDAFAPDLRERVGQALYDALIRGQTEVAFQMALAQAREQEGAVALQLRFDEDAVDLARYPWELLHHRRPLLLSRAVELTRYISYPEAPTALSVTPPLRLLYVEPRPPDLPELPVQQEQEMIRQALARMQKEKVVTVISPPRATYRGMLRILENETVHILHFDGHAAFARKCPKCGRMNAPRTTKCQARTDGSACGQNIALVEPQGYLAFEDEVGGTRWLSGAQLGTLLYGRPVRLAVLSACQGGGVGGETLFRGTAPALIQAGVPAVLAMQLPLDVATAAIFMWGFYSAVSRFETLPAAVNAGRQWVLDTPEWFIPTLYLRSLDDEGALFAPA